MIEFGSSASWIMIWATSTTRLAGSNPLQTSSAKSVTDVPGMKRNLCVRNGPYRSGAPLWCTLLVPNLADSANSRQP
jgi:hypothetical protein